jgi:hypothetical protein
MRFPQFFWHFWMPKLGVMTLPFPQNGRLVGQSCMRSVCSGELQTADDIDGRTSWPTRRIRSFLQSHHPSFSRLGCQVPTPNHKKGGAYGPRPQ